LFKLKITVFLLAIFIFICLSPVNVSLFTVNHLNQNKIYIFDYSNLFPSSFGSADNQITKPNAIGVNSMSGSVYVTDSGNHRIQQFSKNGTFITTWGSEGDANSQFKSPSGIAVNPVSGSVYVADTGNDRIQQFSKNGTFITTWGFTGNINSQFVGPSGIAVNPVSGSVYVADRDNDRIQQFSQNGTFITTWN
jgi:tripartite motif-containing protein 71